LADEGTTLGSDDATEKEVDAGAAAAALTAARGAATGSGNEYALAAAVARPCWYAVTMARMRSLSVKEWRAGGANSVENGENAEASSAGGGGAGGGAPRTGEKTGAFLFNIQFHRNANASLSHAAEQRMHKCFERGVRRDWRQRRQQRLHNRDQ
jgi:hypothetical protein